MVGGKLQIGVASKLGINFESIPRDFGNDFFPGLGRWV